MNVHELVRAEHGQGSGPAGSAHPTDKPLVSDQLMVMVGFPH